MPIFSQTDLQRLQQESQEPGARRARASFIDQAFELQKSSATPATYDINDERPLPAVPVAVAEPAAPAVAEPKKKKIIRIDLTPHKRDQE